MAIYGDQQIGTWVDSKTGMKYSGRRRNPYDSPAILPTTTPEVKPIDVLKEIPSATRTIVTGIQRFAKKTQESFDQAKADDSFIKNSLSSLQTKIAEISPEETAFERKVVKPIALAGLGIADIPLETMDFFGDTMTTVLKHITFKGEDIAVGVGFQTEEKAEKEKQNWVDFWGEVKKTNPIAKIDEVIDELQRSPALQPTKEWLESSLKEKITTRLPETVLQIGPSIVSSMGQFAINPSFGLVTIAGSTANDVKDMAVDYDVPEEKAILLGAATGIFVSWLERIVPNKIFADGGVKNQFIGSFAKRLAETTILEVGTEVTQEAIQIIAEETFRDIGFDEATTRTALSGLGGLIGGAGVQTAASFANDVQRGEILESLKVEEPERGSIRFGETEAEKPQFGDAKAIKERERLVMGKDVVPGTKPKVKPAPPGQKEFYLPPKEFAETNLFKQIEKKKLVEEVPGDPAITKYLLPAETPIEADAQKYVIENLEEAVNNYNEQVKKTYGYDYIISSDDAKKIIPRYSGELAGEYHKPSSALSKYIYDQKLISEKGKRDGTVLFTAGGPGVGKSFAINQAVGRDNPAERSIIYDTNMVGFEVSKDRIQKALDAGFGVEITFVQRSPVESFKNGVLPRVKEENRIIAIPDHIKIHSEAFENLQKLRKHFGKEINVRYIQNTGGIDEIKFVNFDKLQKFVYNEGKLTKELTKLTQESYDRKEITTKEKEAILGRTRGADYGAGDIDGRRDEEGLKEEIRGKRKGKVQEGILGEIGQKELDIRPEDADSLIQKAEEELREAYKTIDPDDINRALGEVWQELDMAEAGTREVIVSAEEGPKEPIGIIAKTSSFPDWIPGHLRNKKLFDKVMGGLMSVDDIQFPTQNRSRQRELYDYLLGKVDDKIGIDTSKLRQQIINNYDKIYKGTGKVQEVVSGGIRGEIPRGVVGVGAPEARGAAEEAVPKTRKFLQSVRNARPDIPLKVGGQYVPRSTDDLAVKAKNLITDNIRTAESLARTGTDDKAVATAAELIKHYGDEALKAKSQAVKNTLYDKASEVAHTTAKNLTEQGRAIQAASIMGNLTPEGILRFAAREINKYNEEAAKSKGLKKKIPQLTPGQTEVILNEFKSIEKMADGTKKAIAFKKLNDSISDLIPSSLYKKIISVWKAGLLTGAKTSGLNTFSNLFHGASEVIKDVPAAAIDSVASLFTKERTLAFTTRGVSGGAKEGFEKGWRYLKTGFDERNVATKLDWKRINFGTSKFAKAIQRYETTIFQLMGAEDQPFYYGAKARSLMSQAIAQAKNKGLKGSKAKEFIENLIKSPTDSMLKYAQIDAEIAVFQNPTTLGKIAKAMQKAPGGELIVPFGRTPSAVANQLINYSPVGIVKTIVQNIGKGRFDQRLFSQALARGIIGAAVMYIGAKLFDKKLINLDYPKGERERKLWEAEGRKPNAVKIDDQWRDVNIFGPAGMILIAGGHYQETLNDTGSISRALVSSVSGGVKTLKEQTFLRGVSQIVDALDDPDRFFEGWFANTISSVIPTIIKDIAVTVDPYQRRTEGVLERIKSRIPGVRETLEPRIDVLGREKARAGNWWETMADPSRPSKILGGVVVEELRRLTDAGHKVSPTLLGDREGYKGLTQEENTALWERAGELINSKLASLFDLEQYKALPDDQKAELVEKVVASAKVMARTQAVIEVTEGMSGQELKSKLGELKSGGLMIRSVFKKYLELQY